MLKKLIARCDERAVVNGGQSLFAGSTPGESTRLLTETEIGSSPILRANLMRAVEVRTNRKTQVGG